VRCAKGWLIHERSTRRKPSLFPAAIITGQRHDVEPISQDQGRNLVAARTLGGIVPHDFNLELDIRGLKRGCSDGARLAAIGMKTIVVGGAVSAVRSRFAAIRLPWDPARSPPQCVRVYYCSRVADYSDAIRSGICGPYRCQSRFNHLECFGI
jgi:hypothetical protein